MFIFELCLHMFLTFISAYVFFQISLHQAHCLESSRPLSFLLNVSRTTGHDPTSDAFPYNCLLWSVRTLCLRRGGLSCVFSVLYLEVIVTQEEWWDALHLLVFLSLFCSPIPTYFIPFSLLRLTPLNSILPLSLNFLPSSLSPPPSPPLPYLFTPSPPPHTSRHHSLISTQSVILAPSALPLFF